MNRGLPEQLKLAFPNIESDKRLIVLKNIPNPNWIAGFTSAEGCFYIKVLKSKKK